MNNEYTIVKDLFNSLKTSAQEQGLFFTLIISGVTLTAAIGLGVFFVPIDAKFIPVIITLIIVSSFYVLMGSLHKIINYYIYASQTIKKLQINLEVSKSSELEKPDTK